MFRSITLVCAALVLALACSAFGMSPTYVSSVTLTNNGDSVFSDNFGSGGLSGWTDARDAVVVPWQSSASGYCLGLSRNGGSASVGHTISVDTPGSVELSAQVWLPKPGQGESGSSLKLYLRSGTIIGTSDRADSVLLSTDWAETGYGLKVLWSGPGAPSEVSARTGAVLKPETWCTLTLRLDTGAGTAAVLLDGVEKASIRIKPENFKSLASLVITNTVGRASEPTPTPHPTPVRPPRTVVRPNSPGTNVSEPEPAPIYGPPAPSPDLPVALRHPGTRGGMYVDDFEVRGGGYVFFSDDFQMGNLDKWSSSFGGTAKCAGALGCCMFVRSLGSKAACIVQRVGIPHPTVVEMSAWVWLPPVEERGKDSPALLLYSHDTEQNVYAQIVADNDGTGYRLRLQWTKSAKEAVASLARGVVIQPQKWTRLTLRLNTQTHSAAAIVDGKQEAHIDMNGCDFPKIDSATIWGWLGDRSPSTPAPAPRPIAPKPIIPPVLGRPGPAPSNDLPVALRRGGAKGGIYVDDFFVRNGDDVVFFDAFTSGNLDLWNSKHDAEVKCAGSSGCCLFVSCAGRMVASAFRGVSIPNPTVVEVSAWIWLPPVSEQDGSSFTNLVVYSGSSDENIFAGPMVDTSGKGYKIRLHVNEADNRGGTSGSEGVVIQPEKWYRLALRVDTKEMTARAFVDGQQQGKIGLNGCNFQSIDNVSIWGWLGDRNLAQ